MCRAGTAPASHGLKGQRATFLLTARDLRARFENSFDAHHDPAGCRRVMDDPALHLERLIARRAKRTLGLSHLLSPLLVDQW